MVVQSKKLIVAIVLTSVSLIAGCFSSHPEDIQAWVKPYEVSVTATSYIVQPPDEIEVHCAQVPEINLQRQRVRPDGKISFEALGDVEVAGKTPEEINAVLGEKVKKLYTLPGDNPVDVRIMVYASHVYYVLGQVARPGPRIYTGRDNLLTSLAEAQPNIMAWEERVQVIRPAAKEDEEARIFEVNYKKITEHGDATKDVLLQDGDIVYVPPTVLASVGMFLEELITPIARAFYGAYLVQNPPMSTDRGYYPYGGGGYR
jgi:protein involved in polysaccharide export with SLBB domain